MIQMSLITAWRSGAYTDSAECVGIIGVFDIQIRCTCRLYMLLWSFNSKLNLDFFQCLCAGACSKWTHCS